MVFIGRSQSGIGLANCSRSVVCGLWKLLQSAKVVSQSAVSNQRSDVCRLNANRQKLTAISLFQINELLNVPQHMRQIGPNARIL